MFTTYPDNYESLYSELVYSYVKTSSSDADPLILVLDGETDETFAIKKFYSSSTADINIAPLVRSYAYPEIIISSTGFVDEANCSSVSVMLIDQWGAMSTKRYFSLSRQSESEVGLLTTLDTDNRTMVLGERDFLLMRVDPSKSITVTLDYYLDGFEEVAITKSYQQDAQEGGFATFVTCAETIYGDVMSRIELVAKQGDDVIAEVEYLLIDPPIDPRRLAWVSSRGSIEHYTFPYVIYRSICQGSQSLLSLRSALESYSTRSAIAEIVDSPKVWIESSTGVYREVSVESEEVELLASTQIGSVDVKISYYDE